MSISMAAMDLRRKKKPPLESLKMAEYSISDTAVASPPTAIASSPSPGTCEGDQRPFSFHSFRDKALRSFSSSRDSLPSVEKGTSRAPSAHSRRLSKSRKLSTGSPFELINRRSSGFSDHGSMSITDSLSTTSSSIVDWRLQNVEGYAPLESDTHLMKTKKAYLVVTTDYLVKVKCHAHLLALFPQISPSKTESTTPVPEPLAVIPIAGIVSVFVSESPRPSFGVEVWWRTLTGVAFHHTTFFFSLPTERVEQMGHIIRTMRSSNSDENEFIRRSYDITELLAKIHDTAEPDFKDQKLEIFPVVPRGNTRKDCSTKAEDAAKKSQEGPAFYLAVGANLCHLVEVQRSKGGEPATQKRTFGLVTLESFKGDWVFHQERFNITFRDPFKPAVTLELASRYYRQIIRVFGTADRFLRPVWPQMWQSLEVFHIAGLREPQYLISQEDYGSVKRTLDAYLAAYHCRPVEWEINWKTRFAPEFRLLPAKHGYTAAQILAVLRALRYNDYFNSLSFRDVDLSILWDVVDNPGKKTNVAYLNRSCITLEADEIDLLRTSPVLHQEFHALAYCSETIRQIDFTNTSKSYESRIAKSSGTSYASLQFLTPILNLLRFGITKCDRLNLSRNKLLQPDIQEIAEAMKAGRIQALDVSFCGLDDMDLRDMVVAPILDGPQSLQTLNICGNPGRLSSHIVPEMLENLMELMVLNMDGSLRGDAAGPLIPAMTLARLEFLEELDISKFRLNNATLFELELFLRHRGQMIDSQQPSRLRKLVLNHCSITGSQAARLFRAIGENHGLELSISGNPLEDGIEDLADAIRQSHTPAALTMDMVEFEEESNYILFIKALCETKYLSLLSLVGTAPTPDPHEPCHPEIIQAFADLFAQNKSIRCLDISGFCEKLDDGQLSKGFGSSLMGLIGNTTITHLRVRSQRLHEDAGTLGRIIQENKTLIAFDCQDNEYNFTSLQFLVSCLRDNTKILDFPFSKRERRNIWKNILSGLHMNKSASSSSSAAAKAQESMLWERYCALFVEIEGYLARNRKAFEEVSGAGQVDFEGLIAHGVPMTEDYMSTPTRSPSGARVYELSGGATVSSSDVGSGVGRGRGQLLENDQEGDSTPIPADASSRLKPAASTARRGRATVHSSSIPVDTSVRGGAPYHVRQGDEGTESPTDTLDPVSEVETPPPEQQMGASIKNLDEMPMMPVMVMPTTQQTTEKQKQEEADDLEWRKMMMQFRETGFDFQ
ncbi:hypothetical protein B0H66DRAFT_355905 [Apodospora peruviana]|uniref:LRR-containing protein second PH domain-containing protein n=1 Tax=Apodospora peruviana TaxID=516989 RepID=A0AAE0LZQ4_9PEZI|nr:hypothetical protein B0H66DRAFT_355905 [Apodospora peruviana]